MSQLPSNLSTRPAQWGDWFPIPDGQIVLRQVIPFGSTVPGLASALWTLPNGSQIVMDDLGDVRYTRNFFQFGGNTISVHDVSVRVSRTTLPGLLQLGLIDQATADALLQRRAQEPAPPQSPGQVIRSSINGLLLIALIGAAIWFLPRNIVRGSRLRRRAAA